MSKKTKIIILISSLFFLLFIIFLGSYYFFWQQAREDCFTLHERKFEEACDSLKNIEVKGDKCIEESDIDCIDLSNYKLFYYLLNKKEQNEATKKICQKVFLAPKSDVSDSKFKNKETFCKDFSNALLERNTQQCDILFEDKFSQNYCRFVLTADKQYCEGDSQKCKDRAILFESFLKDDFSRCGEITDFNTRVACTFFSEFRRNENFSCQGAFGNKDNFFDSGLDKTLCKDLN